MKKTKRKELLKSVRKTIRENIKQNLIAQLKEVTEKISTASKKFEKEIEKGSQKLAKKLSKELKISEAALLEIGEKTEAEALEPVTAHPKPVNSTAGKTASANKSQASKAKKVPAETA